MEIKYIYSKFLECESVSTDTRKINTNSLFIALKGENFNANTFAKKALENGAKYVIIDDKNYFIDQRTILVKDSLTTLQQLAKYHREKLKTTIISLTGSNGKTTTKELINCVLSQKFNTIATDGNLNNHIGVPLTLLRLTKETQIGIIEMGANHQKEIEFLCTIAQPDFGYITNFGKAHLDGFGGIDGVIKGKSEMYNYLIANQKTAIINIDDTIQVEKTKEIKKITFSQTNSKADQYFFKVEANPMVKISFDNTTIQSNLIGIYNANNINAAITLGKYFKIESIAIKKAIENYIPENNRSQMIQKNGNNIILDAYNANPSSMKVALENFFQLKENQKIAILGDMFELGEESFIEHQKIIALLINQPKIKTFLIGKHFYNCRRKLDKISFFESFEAFANSFKSLQLNNHLILIKGSRGMALERSLELI